jgi:hypothetical protein
MRRASATIESITEGSAAHSGVWGAYIRSKLMNLLALQGRNRICAPHTRSNSSSGYFLGLDMAAENLPSPSTAPWNRSLQIGMIPRCEPEF